MANHPAHDNPWQDETSATSGSHQGYANTNPYSTYQQQPQSRDPDTTTTSHGQYQPPPHQHPLSMHPPDHHHHQPQASTPHHDEARWSETRPYEPSTTETPPLPPRRSATDLALPTGQDRSHQIEVMQSYEAAGRRDEHDQNVDMLQREFPKIDGSLIAAIYGDSLSLSATREMLGELEG